jgi:hypothetical protein
MYIAVAFCLPRQFSNERSFNLSTTSGSSSNVTVDQRLIVLNRWKSFLASGGRMVFDMHHSQPQPGRQSRLDCEWEVTLSLEEMLDQYSVTKCVRACAVMEEQPG